MTARTLPLTVRPDMSFFRLVFSPEIDRLYSGASHCPHMYAGSVLSTVMPQDFLAMNVFPRFAPLLAHVPIIQMTDKLCTCTLTRSNCLELLLTCSPSSSSPSSGCPPPASALAPESGRMEASKLSNVRPAEAPDALKSSPAFLNLVWIVSVRHLRWPSCIGDSHAWMFLTYTPADVDLAPGTSGMPETLLAMDPNVPYVLKYGTIGTG